MMTTGHQEDTLAATRPRPAATSPHTPASTETPASGKHAGHGYITAKDDYLKRLKRIEGQARGVHKMVEDEKYCIDILTQISAMTKALQAVAIGLLEDHIGHCVVDAAVAGGPEAEAKIKEATDAIARLVRS
ncbi:metal-sensitive transcriptional regulator (plasmid) [Rhodococcus pyridinivorans]|nr:metal-sensitive transcriptional regulator [Rhodococcus pyridinivorans]